MYPDFGQKRSLLLADGLAPNPPNSPDHKNFSFTFTTANRASIIHLVECVANTAQRIFSVQ